MPIKPVVRVSLLIVMYAGVLSSLSKHASSGGMMATVLGLLLAKKKRFPIVLAVVVAGCFPDTASMDLPLVASIPKLCQAAFSSPVP